MVRLTDAEVARMAYSYTRLTLEVGVVMAVFIIGAFKLFDHQWTDAYETLFLHSHFALLVFVIGAFPAYHRPVDNVYHLPRALLGMLAVITMWCMISDGFLLARAGSALHDQNDSRTQTHLSLAVVAAFLDLLRLIDILAADGRDKAYMASNSYTRLATDAGVAGQASRVLVGADACAACQMEMDGFRPGGDMHGLPACAKHR